MRDESKELELELELTESEFLLEKTPNSGKKLTKKGRQTA